MIINPILQFDLFSASPNPLQDLNPDFYVSSSTY